MKERALREKFMQIAKQKLEEKRKRNDLYIIQLNRTLDDLYGIKNKLEERINEWAYIYGIKEKGKRLVEKIKELKPDKDWIMEKERIEAIKNTAALIEKVEEEIENKENLIEKCTAQILPNAYALIGGKLVAKFLSLAGSIEKLAEMPASTIQVLGAERALFKHLRAKTKPPKHGILLLSHYVNKLPKHKRGKMARALASKLAIAFKADLSGHFIGKELKDAVEKRFKELSKK
ncbi:MAG: hypothetical protein QXI89_02620 [Candidatus Anstonellales archaeon]